MERWFRFPTFEDSAKTRDARMLIIITTLIMGATLFFEFALLAFLGRQISFALVAGVTLVSLVVHMAARLGYVRGGTLVLCSIIWLILTITASFYDGRGVYDVAFSTYVAPVLLASFLMNARTGMIFAVLSSFAGFMMWLLVPFVPRVVNDGALYWAANSILFTFIAAVMWIYERRVRNARLRTENREVQLVARSSELQREIAERARLEEAYRTVVENSLQGLAIFQNRRMVFANSAAAEMHGYPIEELLAAPDVLVFVHPDDRAMIEENMQGRLSDESRPSRYELRLLQRGGEIRWIEVFPVGITYQGQPAIHVAFIDISERKRAEVALKEREEITRDFQNKLTRLHEISIELSTIDSIDDVCRTAIELGRSGLGFDRLGLLLLDEQNQRMIGTFGTGANGELRDERSLSNSLAADSFILEILRENQMVSYREDAELYDNWQPVGRGWNALSVLWTGEKNIGWLATDNLLQKKPIAPNQLELLRLYALALGNILARRRSEEALKRSQEWFAKIFQSSPVSISMSSLPQGTYIDVNPSWSALFGYSREEAIGRSGPELGLWVDTLQREDLVHRIVMEGNLNQQEIVVKDRKGAIHYAMMSSEIIELHGEQLYLSMVFDITERKAAEEARRKSEEQARAFQVKLKALQEISLELAAVESLDEMCRRAIDLGHSALGYDRIGILVFDNDEKSRVSRFGIEPDGRLRAERGMPYQLEQDGVMEHLLLNRELSFVSEEADLRDFSNTIIGQGWNIVTGIWDGTASIGWLAADNLIGKHPLIPYQIELLKLYGLTLGHLVTRKRTEEELRRSEDWFATVFRMAPFAIAIRKQGDMHYLDVNESWCDLYGYSREEAIGRGAVELNLWYDPQQRTQMLEKLELEGRLNDMEVVVRRCDGNLRTVLVSTEIVDLHGSPHVLSTIADITERKEVEQQRLELALTNERLELFREFMTNISHDLKTPLAVINTSVELMERIKDAERQREKMAAIKEQTARLDKYIHDMLTISRLDHAPDLLLRPVDINRLASDIQERLRSTSERKEVTTILELDQNIPYVLADEGEMDRMMVNLVENALNYTPAGGQVWIRTCVNGDNVHLEIADTGIGIGAKDLVRIFDRFYRADTARSTKISGTGLGLAIVKRIVEMHGGSIDVRSTPGEGTTFFVELPLMNMSEP